MKPEEKAALSIEETPALAVAESFPPQIKYIIGNEACERFSYYGMLSILTLYLKNVMDMGEVHSKEVVHLFATAVYFLPLAGGWLADRWLGRYRTILSISLFYCLGHGALALFEGQLAGVYLGLGLIAIGAGGIKPCVSAFVGDQFKSTQESLLTRVYGWFYWSINLGAFFGFAFIPWLRERAGYRWAFGIPGIFMALATFIFWLGRKHYRRQPPLGASQRGVWRVWLYAWRHRRERRPGERFLDNARVRFGQEEVEATRAVGGILMMFATVPVFWALFNQINTTWVLQGEKMVPFYVFGYRVDGERMQSASALLVMIWVPILTYGVYPLAARLGLRLSPLRRMGTGMVLGAVAFFICGWIQMRMDQGEALSLCWQLAPYVVLEAGEVMLSATALEFAFSQAPQRMKSMVMSFWLMTIAGGHFLVAAFTKLNASFVHARGASEFFFYATLMVVVTGVFIFLATRYRVP
jgi:POT family proton-dependent oligopeptide transporter